MHTIIHKNVCIIGLEYIHNNLHSSTCNSINNLHSSTCNSINNLHSSACNSTNTEVNLVADTCNSTKIAHKMIHIHMCIQ